jgi:hypothetical protein
MTPMDSKDIKISKKVFNCFFFPRSAHLPIQDVSGDGETPFFWVLPITDFGSGPKCAYQDPKAAMGSTKICLEHQAKVQTSKKEANNTFVLPAIRRTLCLLLKVRDKVLKLKESKKKEYVRQSNRHKNRAFSCLL